MNNVSFAIPLVALLMSIIVSYTFSKIKKRSIWKFAVIIVLNAMAVMVYRALPSYMGWAISSPPPQHFSLQWMVINEPNPLTRTEGGIYLWVKSYEYSSDWFVSLLGYNANEGEPRAMKIQYSRKAHEQMEGLMNKLKAGERVTGKISKQSQFDGKSGEYQEIESFEQYDLPNANRQRKNYE